MISNNEIFLKNIALLGGSADKTAVSKKSMGNIWIAGGVLLIAVLTLGLTIYSIVDKAQDVHEEETENNLVLNTEGNDDDSITDYNAVSSSASKTEFSDKLWIIIGLIVVLSCTGGFLFYKHHQKSKK
ncbi:hypothetical protein CPAV1605_67 [seawater metagenome]|uniref:LPXTG cell wall anchor domain n=1 Tax=seawater metagenome TaxID=1561972 RepID=A0A5E8CKQ5_9ZZZZ